MPGAYAHMTLVNVLKEPERLEAMSNFPNEAIAAVLEYFRFTELGAVSPDYPYLVINDNNAMKWADAMHYTSTGAMIREGVNILKQRNGEEKRKGLAWLLGYVAHVATDVTIHPIVELKVGNYADHKREHRECEMHQDAYIFKRLNLGEIGLSEHLDSGIARCGGQGNRNSLDTAIVTLWEELLKKVHPEQYAANKPDIKTWHHCFMKVVDEIAEEGNRLAPLSRHVAVNAGLTYPAASNVDKKKYIDKLQISHPPSPANFLSYDRIFDQAVNNVRDMWEIVASAIFHSDSRYLARIGEWDLDTGRDRRDNKLVFWS